MPVDDKFDDLERRMADLLKAETEKAGKASFTKEQMVTHLDTPDAGNAVLRGHLYFEHIIMQAITEALSEPSQLDLRRLSFPSKLDLALALGLLPPSYRGIAAMLNELRNKVAHRLDFEFTQEHSNMAWSALPDEVRTTLVEFAAERQKDFGPDIKLILVGVIMMAENYRIAAAQTRAQAKVGEMHVKEAVELARPAMEARRRRS
jgi:hypothetical protein